MMRSMSDMDIDRRITTVEAALFRFGGTLDEIKVEQDHVYSETRGLAEWTSRIDQKMDAQHDETQVRFDELSAKVDDLGARMNSLGEILTRVLAHLEPKDDAS